MLNFILHSTVFQRAYVQCEFYEVLKSESTVHLCYMSTKNVLLSIEWYAPKYSFSLKRKQHTKKRIQAIDD